LNDVASKVDGRVPSLVGRVPREMIGTNRINKASVGVFVISERAVANLAIEGSVREIRPSNNGLMGNIARSRVSQSELVAVHELLPGLKTVMSNEEPFLPTGTVLVDVERVDADLGLVVRGGFHVVGRRLSEVTRAVVVHRGLGERRLGFG